jgi:hypothetical protein
MMATVHDLATAAAQRLSPLGFTAGIALIVTAWWVASEGDPALPVALLLAAGGAVLIALRPHLGVLVLTSTFFLSYPAVLEGRGGLTLNNAVGALLGGVLLVRLAVERCADVLWSRLLGAFLVVGAVTAVSVLCERDGGDLGLLAPYDLTAARGRDLVTRLAYLLFVVVFVRTRAQLLVLVSALIAFVLMTAPNAVWNALTSSGDIEQVRASADFGIVAARNANRLALLCTITIAIVGHALLAARSRRWLVPGVSAIALAVVTVFFTASRAGLLGLGLLAIVFGRRYGLRGGRAIGLYVVVVAVVLLALLYAPAAYLERMTNFSEADEAAKGGASIAERDRLLDVGIRMFLEHPLIGVGLGNFRWLSVVEYGHARPEAAHNSVLLALVEGGVVLLAAYVLLFVLAFGELRRARSAGGHELPWLAQGIQAALLLFLLFSLFADLWHEVYLYLLVGIAAVLGRLAREQEAS